MSRKLLAALLCAFIACSLHCTAQDAEHREHKEHWVGTWAAAPVAQTNDHQEFAQDSTLRETVHVSLGGSSLRVVLTNEFGESDLHIGGAGVSAAAGSAPQPLTFNGSPEVIIPAHASVVSDPTQIALAPLSDLTISIFIPGQTIATITEHSDAQQTNLIADGNQLTQPALSSPHTLDTWPFLKAVEVLAPAKARAIVAFGDSITDGWRSTPNANRRWPDELARRLQADKHAHGVGVLNLGISGNRLVHDGFGPNALSRFDRDVLSQNGVRYLIVMEGINDIGHIPGAQPPFVPVETPQLLFALQQIVERAHAHGILVYAATLTPNGGAVDASATGETMRSAENDFIRTSKLFDGVIDFDAVTRDPAKPTIFAPLFDSDDHLHPNDAGYKAMGDSIDLKLFTK